MHGTCLVLITDGQEGRECHKLENKITDSTRSDGG